MLEYPFFPEWSKSGYLNDRTVLVDHKLIQHLIPEAENILRIEPREREYELWIAGEVGRFSDAAYSGGEFEFLPRTKDSIVFHEIVHFLMDKEGLLLGENVSPKSEHPLCFHARLIDETMAILATSEIYPLDERLPCFHFYKPECIGKDLATCLDLFGMHLSIEKDFLGGRKNLEDTVKDAEQFSSGLDIKIAPLVINYTATRSAYDLGRKKISAKQLFLAIKNSGYLDRRYIHMYFNDVAGAQITNFHSTCGTAQAP